MPHCGSRFGLDWRVSACAVFYGFYVASLWFMNSRSRQGVVIDIIVISFLCGINMLMTGIMGLYIGRIHAEVKRRPLYVVSQKLGFERGCQSKCVALLRRVGELKRPDGRVIR